MSREIKFRALYEGAWYYQTLEEIITITLAAFRKGKHKTQYTGLKDKNGKGEELYEGDLITNTSRNGRNPHPITWGNKMGAFVGDYGLKYLIAEELAEIKKVGNIYEHPHLLNERQKTNT